MSLGEVVFIRGVVLLVFGQNIRKAREKQMLGIAQLAARIKYDRIRLSKLEHGEQNIRLSTALKLAQALDVSFPALFSRNFLVEQADDNVNPVGSYYEDDYLSVFVENFRRCLQCKQNKQMSVYIETGVPESMVSRIVQGRIADPTLQSLWALAHAANADMSGLFSRT